MVLQIKLKSVVYWVIQYIVNLKKLEESREFGSLVTMITLQ